jgi:hypothetical protein
MQDGLKRGQEGHEQRDVVFLADGPEPLGEGQRQVQAGPGGREMFGSSGADSRCGAVASRPRRADASS